MGYCVNIHWSDKIANKEFWRKLADIIRIRLPGLPDTPLVISEVFEQIIKYWLHVSRHLHITKITQISLFPSNIQHLRCDDCLKMKEQTIRTVAWTTILHLQKHNHMRNSYKHATTCCFTFRLSVCFLNSKSPSLRTVLHKFSPVVVSLLSAPVQPISGKDSPPELLRPMGRSCIHSYPRCRYTQKVKQNEN